MRNYTIITQDNTFVIQSNHPKIAKDGSIIFTRDDQPDFLLAYSVNYWKQCFASDDQGKMLGKELKAIG